jgi:hypothetical protein
MVEYGHQPVRVGSFGCARYPPRRWRCPRSVREQEVDPRRLERSKRLVPSYRIVAQIERAQQPTVVGDQVSAGQQRRQPVRVSMFADKLAVSSVTGQIAPAVDMTMTPETGQDSSHPS